jgi:hypothetical protein
MFARMGLLASQLAEDAATPDGMLADLVAQPAQTDPEHREFEALERLDQFTPVEPSQATFQHR